MCLPRKHNKLQGFSRGVVLIKQQGFFKILLTLNAMWYLENVAYTYSINSFQD